MFEVGDLVIGSEDSPYEYTGRGIVCEVISNTGGGSLYNLQVAPLSDYSEISDFPVDERFFYPITVMDELEDKQEEIKVPKVKRSAALKEAVEKIKAAGFSHIKVEMEADLGRDGERTCDYCDGEGREDCDNCVGEGYIGTGNYTRISDEEVMEECMDCDGEGLRDCSECHGSGNSGNFESTETCETFLKDWVPADVRQRLTYGYFYEDGSVDSEYTFTVPIDNIEDVLIWMKAWNALSEDIGGYMDVEGAGLHITILPDSAGGSYPCDQASLNSDGIRNFQSEVTKLMPALFFLASSGHQSRDLRYRYPTISTEKYDCPMDAVAICTHGDSCIEYRVFETCYDNPERFYDFVQVIANTLKFYTDSSLKVKTLGKNFGFNESGDSVSRFYDTAEQLRILNATVKHLKPRDKSYKKMKEERGVRYTIASLAMKEKQKMADLRQDYRDYRKHWMVQNPKPLTDSEELTVNRLVAETPLTRDQAVDEVRGSYGKMMTLTQFIQDNIRHSYDEVLAV